MREFVDKLKEEVNANICRDTEKWRTEYVTLPSKFIGSKDNMFYAGNEELVQKELEITRESQLGDGSYIVPWLWYNEYKEYELAANWWKSRILIDKIRFLKAFG